MAGTLRRGLNGRGMVGWMIFSEGGAPVYISKFHYAKNGHVVDLVIQLTISVVRINWPFEIS